MSKKTLLFDASVISDNISNFSAGRSGIYFAAYNILTNLVKSQQFDISLFCNNVCSKDFIAFVEKNFGKDIKIYFGNKYAVLLNKLSILDTKLRAKRCNITKLLLNIFVRKPIHMIGRLHKTQNFDIVISPIYIPSNKIKATKKYVVLYDAIPILLPNYYDALRCKKNFWYDTLIKYIKSKPKCKYFAISQSTKNDFVRLLNVHPDDIIVTPLAAGDNFYQEQDKSKIRKILEKYNIPTNKKYIFSLCTLEPRKNLIRAIKTFIEFIKKNKIDDMVFVLGGGHWNKFIEKLEGEIQDLGKYRNKIIRAGYVDDADLAALYSGAQWFVYTSQYEGFGLPPLEAMKCGCPVITSNNSSLPEVVGDAGITIDWDNNKQHIAAYEKYYFDEKYRKSMATRGLARSKLFSWDKTIQIIIDEFNKGFDV